MGIPGITEYEIQGYGIKAFVTDPLWKSNCYLVTCRTTGEQVLIDPGSNEDFIILNVLANGTGGLRHILFTHGHFDHVGAAVAVAEKFGVFSMIHKSDLRLMRHAPFYSLRYDKKPLATPDRFVSFEGVPDISIGGQPITAIHTPGHTAGSVCYALASCVFTGDTLLNKYIGRTDQPGGDEAAIHVSIKRLLVGFVDDAIIFPGHGKPWTVAEARKWWQESKDFPPMHDKFTDLTGM